MTQNSFKDISLNAEALTPQPEAVLRAMGYRDTDIPGQLQDLLQPILTEALSHLRIRCAWQLFEPDELLFSRKMLRLREQDFHIQSIIASQIRSCDRIALFVCTLGPDFDDWIRSLNDASDTLPAYVADTVGSEWVENAADQLCAELQTSLNASGLKITNRFSPGYCGWSVKEQHALFSFFPPKICGITLTESALMQPLKSVSGLIGVGPEAVKKDYFCSICDAEDCYKRR